MRYNANGVAANVARVRRKRNGRNRVAVDDVAWTLTQGSAFCATLGFGKESRWDSAARPHTALDNAMLQM
jgi:hypothetical protein